MGFGRETESEVMIKRVVLITAAALLCCGAASAEVVFLSQYNTAIDADFSAGPAKARPYGGAKLTSGGQGRPFSGEATSEALDLGYSDAQKAAGVEYPVPVTDLRSGTIQLWIKTGFNWRDKAEVLIKKWDEHHFLSIPMSGGVHNTISLGWYNRFRPWLNFLVHDGEKTVQVGVLADKFDALKMDTRPGLWHYIVVTWTPLEFRIFVDGTLAEERTLEKPINFTFPDGPMVLGAGKRHGVTLPTANAMIDGFRMSGRPLYAGAKQIPVPEKPLSMEEEEDAKKVLAVGGPGTVKYAKPPTLYSAPKFDTPPTVDGDLTDTAWKTAPRASGFVGITMEHLYLNNQTVIRAGWDEENLYVGVTCGESLMDKLKVTAAGRDSVVFRDDAIEIFVGPWPDSITEYFQLAVNTDKGSYDGKGRDLTWNSTWQAAVGKKDHEWTVEMSIPFKSLGAPTPVHGTLWKWNVARDRQAGGGIEQFSSWAEVGGYHTPEDFNKLLFVDGSVDIAAEEAKYNRDYFAATAEEISTKLAEAKRELSFADRILSKAKVTDAITAVGERLARRKDALKAFLEKKTPDLGEYNALRLGFRQFDASLTDYGEAVNRLGFASIEKLPADTKKGIIRSDDYWFLSNDEMTAAVDASTGVLCGIYDREKTPVVRWSYDLYFVKTKDALVKSDERVDEVEQAAPAGESLEVTCRNPYLPGIRIFKRYFFSSVGAEQRILCREVGVAGEPEDKTLFYVVSRTKFDEKFREHAYYSRVKPAGTMGDARSLFRAADITDPILLHFLFNIGAAAQLCAANTAADNGIGQYWFKADGKWVVPHGYEANKSYFTDTGWDMSWFVTFISPEPRTAEMRYHLFSGDRTAFQSEYRDLPERQAVINAVPVSPSARGRRYDEVSFGPLEHHYDVRDPKSQRGMVGRFLHGRLRSRETASGWYVPYRDYVFGDYPVGDDALLVTTYGGKPHYPAKKIKEGLAKAKELLPRAQSGWYHAPQFLCVDSSAFKSHPEWVMKDPHGVPVPADWHVLYRCGNFCPAFVDHLVSRLTREMDYYGMEMMYLDYSISGPVVDWEHGNVRHSPVSYDFLIRLYRAVQKRNGVLFLNSQTFDGIHDLGYFETSAISLKTGYGNWRDSAEPLFMRKIFTRPGAKSVVLYWKGGDRFGENKNYRGYTNHLLSLFLFPTSCHHDPYPIHFKDPETGETDWAANSAHTVAYFDTMFEADPAVWFDCGLQPAWWRDLDTNIEAYCFRKGPACIMTALRHEEKTDDVTLSVETAKLGFSAERDAFLWQFKPRDPDTFPRRGGPQPENWDRLFTGRICTVVPAKALKKSRLVVPVPALEPELTRILALTQVPAVFWSLEGQETNLLLPELLNCRIEGSMNPSGVRYEVNVSSVYPAEILLYSPPQWPDLTITVNGRSEDSEVWQAGRTDFRRVSVPAGDSVVRVER